MEAFTGRKKCFAKLHRQFNISTTCDAGGDADEEKGHGSAGKGQGSQQDKGRGPAKKKMKTAEGEDSKEGERTGWGGEKAQAQER